MGMRRRRYRHGTSDFWVGNFSAPWLVLAFVAGRTQRSLALGMLAGVLADVGCVVGFHLGFLTLDPLELGMPATSGGWSVATTSFAHWIGFIARWLLAALLAGAAHGAPGWWWRRSRAAIAGLAVAAPFLAEPLPWPLRNGYYHGPWPLWAAEIVVGLAILAALRTRTRRDALSLDPG